MITKILKLVAVGLILSNCNPTTPIQKEADSNLPLIELSWQLNEDGSYGVYADSLSIQHFYPHIDGQAIRPLSYKVEKSQNGGTFTYTLAGDKEVKLTLARDSFSLTLSSALKGFTAAPEYFSPAGAGQMEKVDRLFKQGLGGLVH